MIEESYTPAKQLLKSCLDELKAGARLLLERETITPDDFPSLQRHEEEIASTVPPEAPADGPSVPSRNAPYGLRHHDVQDGSAISGN